MSAVVLGWKRAAAVALACGACAPEPKGTAGEVLNLRILTIAGEPSEEPVEVGPPDADHLLYTFAQAPEPIPVTVLAVDPRVASGAGDRRAEVGDPFEDLHISVWACLASDTPCAPWAPGTLTVVDDLPAHFDTFDFTFAPTREQLNAWLADAPDAGLDRVSVRLDVSIRNGHDEAAWAFGHVAYYPPYVDVADRAVVRAPNQSPWDVQLGDPTGWPVDDLPWLHDLTFRTRPGGRGLLSARYPRDVNVRPILASQPTYGFDKYYPYTVRQEDPEADVFTLGYVGGETRQPIWADGAVRVPVPPNAAELPATAYLVLRDGRGGAAWAHISLLPLVSGVYSPEPVLFKDTSGE